MRAHLPGLRAGVRTQYAINGVPRPFGASGHEVGVDAHRESRVRMVQPLRQRLDRLTGVEQHGGEQHRVAVTLPVGLELRQVTHVMPDNIRLPRSPRNEAFSTLSGGSKS